MIRAVGKVLCCWLFGMSFGWTSPGPPAAGEKRPVDGIYDPLEAISPQGKSALIREAAAVRESSGIDILVVVVWQLHDWEPQALAEDLANRWGYHGGRALVLWVPDEREKNPWIAVSGMVRREIPGAKLEMIVERAKARGRTDPSIDESIRRTVVSLGEDLRFAAGSALRKPEQKAVKPQLRTIDAVMILLRDSKKIAVAAVGGIGLLVVGVYSTIKIYWKLRMILVPRKFPDVSWKRRFGAPHGAIVYTSSPRKHPHTHEIR